MIRYHLFDTGFCVVPQPILLAGSLRRPLALHSIAALLHHPQQGWLLWDTGYAPRMLQATRAWPFWLYRLATPLYLPPRGAVVDQLPQLGLTPADIRVIILSHFHADHIAGLHDFPNATYIATETAYNDIADRRGVAALRRGYIPALLPIDFRQRVRLIAPTEFTAEPLPALGATYDLFGDGLLRLVPLPGHAHGQVGLVAQTDQGGVLFAADGCWLRRAYRERRCPSPLVRLFVADYPATCATIYCLSDFARAQPTVTIIPSHCPEALREDRIQA